MASLLICATTAPPTPSPHRRSSSRPLFPNLSHFPNHANRHRRLHVSSSATQPQNSDDSSPPKVDRRNMILGVCGLYGAGNLISTPAAMADPVEAPDLSKCGVATEVLADDTIDLNCCLKNMGITDYKLPPVFQMKVRPSAHRVSPEYVYKYNMAVDIMKRLPADDPRSFMQQANIHCAYCNNVYKQGGTNVDLQIHNSWLFFPFHRWYLYFHERILGKLIDDPTFVLPFWNWDNPKGMTIPPMFVDSRSALYDSKRNPKNMPPAVVDYGITKATDPLQIVANNLTSMNNEMVRVNSDVYGFMGEKARGPGAPERGSHSAVHVWVGDPREKLGEDMGTFYSAGRDPLFYCHHANVDRMWAIWEHLPSKEIPDKKITDPDFLNSSFLFYDENAQLVRVFVKDSLDNLRMGYDYERIDLPWLDLPPRQSRPARNRKSTVAPAGVTVFPLTLDKVVRFQVDKTKKGKADELLVLEDITVDTSKFLKLDVFVNMEDDNFAELDKAAYAGTYAQVPHKTTDQFTTTSIKLNLKELYEDMDVEDDDTIVVTLVPRHMGPGVTIGGVKVVENPPKPKKA
ncbi:hypothetical protein ACS0TY_019016 [Phlomoides rotata]